jgi:hypothetical protein
VAATKAEAELQARRRERLQEKMKDRVVLSHKERVKKMAE